MKDKFIGMEVPKMVTVNEAAKLTNLAKYHIRRLIHENKVKFILCGVKYLINFGSLVKYLQEGDSEAKTRKEGM